MIQIPRTIKFAFRATVAAAAAALLFAFTSCDSSVTIQAKKDSSCDISMEADIGRTVYDTIKAVTAGVSQMGDSAKEGNSADRGDSTPLFSAAEIKAALSSGDITDVAVSTSSNTAVSVKGTLPAPADQKAVLDGRGVKLANFVTCTKNSLTVILAPETMRSIAASLPDD